MPRRPPRLVRVEQGPLIPNALVAIVVIVVAEAMLFAGLIGSYLVFRLSAPTWPPADLPRLPLALTIANTAVLLSSLAPLTRALRAARRGDSAVVLRGVRATTVLGVAFLAIQGFEWVRLVGHGVTLGSSIFGATFYLLIGAHGAHVLVAVVWLAVLAGMARRGLLTVDRHGALEMGTVYWYFVCILWVALFVLVYLA